MSIQTFAKGTGIPSTLTNPLTGTTGVAFPGVTLTMTNPSYPLSGEPISLASFSAAIPFTVRASGTFFCNSGTTPSLTVSLYCQGVAGTQVATTGAVQVGLTEPSSGSWFIEGRYIWDSTSGLNGMYWGFVGGQNSVASSPQRNMNYVTNVSATTFPANVTFTPTAFFSATGATNTVTITSLVMDYV